MANKIWYEIQLTNADGFNEIIARVKSKGLAYIVLQQLVLTYANTNYTVKMV